MTPTDNDFSLDELLDQVQPERSLDEMLSEILDLTELPAPPPLIQKEIRYLFPKLWVSLALIVGLGAGFLAAKWLTPPSNFEEVIEPLLPPTELERLAPTELT